MASAFENLPDDIIYSIRTFLDFTAEMALDSTSKTIRSVMRDVVHPRCKVLDFDKELDDSIQFPPGIDISKTFRKYANKISKHLTSFINMDSGLFMIPPVLWRMPLLKHMCISAPIIIHEDVVHEIHMFPIAVIYFWQRIWEYLESGRLITLKIHEPTKFSIDEQDYVCTPQAADRIYMHVLEDTNVHSPLCGSSELRELRLPIRSVTDFGMLYDLFPNANISHWGIMDDPTVERQARLNRLLSAAL
jgi:hypothetical protein